MSEPPPQLARKVYSLEDDDDDSSLEIILPEKKKIEQNRDESSKSFSSQSRKMKQSMASKVASLLMESSDSEDDDLLRKAKSTFTRQNGRECRFVLTAHSSAESREVARARKKRETAERKQCEKIAKARKREYEKSDRERQKLEEKDRRKRQVKEHQQSSGKYAHQEIVLLMDPLIYNNKNYGLADALNEDFLIHPHHSTLIKEKTIQFIRKDYLRGGAEDALKRLERNEVEKFEHISYIVLLLEPDDFLPLLAREGHDVDDDYPLLENFISTLISRWQQIWETQKQPSIVLILNQVPETLDSQWTSRRRNKGPTAQPLPTEWELQDAIQWLLIRFQVECILCKSIESIQANVNKLTRGLCEAPYIKNVTELQCIKKIKKIIDGDRSIDRARDSWLRQLQQVPRISESIAVNVVQHYPTMQSLWQTYQHGDNSTNSVLTADIFSSKSRQTKLSDNLHRLMTSEDPKQMLI